MLVEWASHSCANKTLRCRTKVKRIDSAKPSFLYARSDIANISRVCVPLEYNENNIGMIGFHCCGLNGNSIRESKNFPRVFDVLRSAFYPKFDIGKYVFPI